MWNVALQDIHHTLMPALVIDPSTSSRSRGGEVVDRYPCEDLIVGPGEGVSPVVELLVDPGKEGDGAVVETVSKRLWFCGLEFVIAEAFFTEPFAPCDAGFFQGCIRRQCVLCS